MAANCCRGEKMEQNIDKVKNDSREKYVTEKQDKNTNNSTDFTRGIHYYLRNVENTGRTFVMQYAKEES